MHTAPRTDLTYMTCVTDGTKDTGSGSDREEAQELREHGK